MGERKSHCGHLRAGASIALLGGIAVAGCAATAPRRPASPTPAAPTAPSCDLPRLSHELDTAWRAVPASAASVPANATAAMIDQHLTSVAERTATPIPPAELDLANAIDAYVGCASRSSAKPGSLEPLRMRAAEIYFRHGRFVEARARYEPAFEQGCRRTESGFVAWLRLLAIAHFVADFARSRALAERSGRRRGCAMTPEHRALEDLYVNPRSESLFWLGRRAWLAAQNTNATPFDRDARHEEAGTLFEMFVAESPGRAEAPDAAMLGARAWAAIHRPERERHLLEVFIARFADESTLDRLEHGDPHSAPPQPPDADRYRERVAQLRDAYRALAANRSAAGDRPAAADALLSIADNPRFNLDDRGQAACCAQEQASDDDLKARVQGLLTSLGVSCDRARGKNCATPRTHNNESELTLIRPTRRPLQSGRLPVEHLLDGLADPPSVRTGESLNAVFFVELGTKAGLHFDGSLRVLTQVE